MQRVRKKMMMKPNDAKMMMPRTRKNTRSINSLAEARNVCSRIFNPDECRVNLNSLRVMMMVVMVMIRMMVKMIFSPDEFRSHWTWWWWTQLMMIDSIGLWLALVGFDWLWLIFMYFNSDGVGLTLLIAKGGLWPIILDIEYSGFGWFWLAFLFSGWLCWTWGSWWWKRTQGRQRSPCGRRHGRAPQFDLVNHIVLLCSQLFISG